MQAAEPGQQKGQRDWGGVSGVRDVTRSEVYVRL